ncbi:enoyl-CoA hydratase [Pseudonocardia sp. MH-G8]|uniref:enoyl-CoA hydratase n=1 Tax=Pseudonocardia sp. MH-G8 TaxID=1854588 RepID=UPI000BA12C82|nr:enoyl-CoA hydratase [Pseudonocardia sp. MH-G8]OZM77472.1 enoyl-CoA hydratase [Pseudonocardia sp. MH-G8]
MTDDHRGGASRHVEVDVDGAGVATLTFRDAKGLNILATPVVERLTGLLDDLAARPELRVLVLRGSGDRAFSAGADVHEMARLEPGSARAFIRRLARLCETVRTFPVPVLARIPGWCLGGALELAMACDLRISSTEGRFAMPEIEVGIPSVIHAALLPRLVGAARARRLILTGETVDARTALDWGLVDQVVEADQLDDAVRRAAERLAGFGPLVVRQQKRLLREWEEQGLCEAVEASVAEFGAAFETGEPQERMQRFLARKRG